MVVWLGYLVYCAFVSLLVCMVMDFSAAEKDSGMKLCMLVQLLSRMSCSHFSELLPTGGSPRSLNADF